jgi:hypothetical protein
MKTYGYGLIGICSLDLELCFVEMNQRGVDEQPLSNVVA